MLTRALVYVGVVTLSTGFGFALHAMLTALAEADLRQAVVYWQRRALRAEAAHPVPLFTYTPSAAQQRQGLRVVQGGRR